MFIRYIIIVFKIDRMFTYVCPLFHMFNAMKLTNKDLVKLNNRLTR